MVDQKIDTIVAGGQIQGVAGAGTVVIENFTIYNRAVEDDSSLAANDHSLAPCPYPGLAYFGPDDAGRFFGRDSAISRLAETVSRQSFTTLVGASGSGKSSVVLAGLAPRLHVAGGWRFSHFRIGTELESNPFLALSRALVPLYVTSDSDTERLRNTKQLAESLARGELTLRDAFADCRSRNKERRILMIADQFEEVFTLVEDEAVRARFIDALLDGFPDPPAGQEPSISLILTLRADFYSRALSHRPLADALQGHIENLGPMTRDELRAAILRPAEGSKVEFEPGLAEALLDHVENKPGSLPLLQFALREMWQRQAKRQITRRSYDEIGGVEGALAQRAESVFATLTGDGANSAVEKNFRRLFTRLVTLGEGQEDTRRVVERRELDDAAWLLAQRLAGEDNRLVVANAPVFSTETVEVVHEALIRHWPRLVDWINRDRAFQSWLRQIRPNVELWSADPSDEAPLLRGGMLAQASEWLSRRHDELSPTERHYIEAGVALRQRMEWESEAARLAEVENQRLLTAAAAKLAKEERRRARVAFVGVVVSTSLAIATAVAAVRSFRYGDEAEQSKLAAEAALKSALDHAATAQRSRALMIASASMKETELNRPELGLLLGLYADPQGERKAEFSHAKRDDIPSVTSAIERAVYSGIPSHRARLSGPGQEIYWSKDGHAILTLTDDFDLTLWNAETVRKIKNLTKEDALSVGAALSSDGKYIAAAVENLVFILDSETMNKVVTLSGHHDNVLGVSFSDDGSTLITDSSDKTIRIWDAHSGKERLSISTGNRSISDAAISADGSLIVAGLSDNSTSVWDAHTGKQAASRGATEEYPSDVTFSPDGRLVATTLSHDATEIWDPRTGQTTAVLAAQGTTVRQVVFSPDGRHLATVSDDKRIRFWDARNGSLTGVLYSNADGEAGVDFSPDGRKIATVSNDGSLLVWDINLILEQSVISVSKRGVSNIGFSPDGRIMATAGGMNRSFSMWNSETGAEIYRMGGLEGVINSVRFSSTGQFLATSSYDATARIWDVTTGRQIQVFKGRGGTVENAIFSPDDRLLLTSSSDGGVRVWDMQTGELLHNVRIFTPDAMAHDPVEIIFTLDSGIFVTASNEEIKYWNSLSGNLIESLKYSGKMIGIGYYGEHIYTCTSDPEGNVNLFDITAGEPIGKLVGNGMRVSSCVISPDNRHVATIAIDSVVRIWDIKSSSEVRALRDIIGDRIYKPRMVAFSPSGDRVAIAVGENVRIFFNIESEQDLWNMAYTRKLRELSEYESNLYHLD